MVGRQLPPTLPPLTFHTMNLSTMIDSSIPAHSPPLHSLPSQLPPLPHYTAHNQASHFRSHSPTPPFPSLPTLTSPPLPKLPPLSSHLAPVPTSSVSQPVYQDPPLSSIHTVLPYSTNLPQISQPLANTQQLSTFQPSSAITADPAPLPPPPSASQHAPFHDSAPLVARSQRITPLSLPLPNTKPIYSDAHAIPYDPASQPTVSPVSVAQTNDPVYCVSPVSASQPADYSLPTAAQTAVHPPTQTRPPVDDSLIARLRGFNGSIPPARPAVSVLRGEPQIRDTSESLAVGYVDALPGRDRGHVASQPDTVAVSPDRPHACRKCSATFRRRDNLMAHIRAQHKGERPFKCEVCGFRFIKKDHAMKHWKVVHLKERPFVCTRCNSRFGQRSDLNKHVRSVHLRIKPFECEHCGLRFSHRGNQIRHQAVVHEKKKPFNCTECTSSFAEKSNLLKHCQAVHKNGNAFSS